MILYTFWKPKHWLSSFEIPDWYFTYAIKVEPRFNEVAGDRPHLFVESRVHYCISMKPWYNELEGNDQTDRYIEVIVKDWFVTQVTSVTQFNATFVTQKCHILRYNSLNIVAFSVDYFQFWAGMQLLFTVQWNDTLRVAILRPASHKIDK